uniref:Uncharacterized protein n=1 Tax=viral metagenome TaxID=1070528 RepID=A0A6C0K160_9ZZZZ
MDAQQFGGGGGGGMLRQQAMSDPRLKKEYLTRFLQRLGQKHDIKQESVDFLRLKHHRMYLKALATLFCTFSYPHVDPHIEDRHHTLYLDLMTAKENEKVSIGVGHHYLQFIITFGADDMFISEIHTSSEYLLSEVLRKYRFDIDSFITDNYSITQPLKINFNYKLGCAKMLLTVANQPYTYQDTQVLRRQEEYFDAMIEEARERGDDATMTKAQAIKTRHKNRLLTDSKVVFDIKRQRRRHVPTGSEKALLQLLNTLSLVQRF